MLECYTRSRMFIYIYTLFQVVGSSLLIVRDDRKLGAWVIDFAKARAVADPLDHRTPWVEGNHEEGFLFGLDSLIEVGAFRCLCFRTWRQLMHWVLQLKFCKKQNKKSRYINYQQMILTNCESNLWLNTNQCCNQTNYDTTL